MRSLSEIVQRIEQLEAAKMQLLHPPVIVGERMDRGDAPRTSESLNGELAALYWVVDVKRPWNARHPDDDDLITIVADKMAPVNKQAEGTDESAEP